MTPLRSSVGSRETQEANIPTDECENVGLFDKPPATMFRFFEYNGKGLTSKTLVSGDMEIYLESRQNWTWLRRDNYSFQTIRADKVIDSMCRLADFNYCLIPNAKVDWWMQKGATIMIDHLQRRARHATTRVNKTGLQRRGKNVKVAEAYLQSRGPSLAQRGRENGTLTQTRTILPAGQTSTSSDAEPQAQTLSASPENVTEWISSIVWITKEKTLGERCNLADCEREQENTNWALDSSQACLLLYEDHENCKLLVYRTQQTLSVEEVGLISDRFYFMIAANGHLHKVDLDTAWRGADSLHVWVVPKNELNSFRSRWTQDHREDRPITMMASPGLKEPVPPDAGDSTRHDALFDDDSFDENHGSSTSGDDFPQINHNNSTLEVSRPEYTSALPSEDHASKSGDALDISSTKPQNIEEQPAEQTTSVPADHQVSEVSASQDLNGDDDLAGGAREELNIKSPIAEGDHQQISSSTDTDISISKSTTHSHGREMGAGIDADSDRHQSLQGQGQIDAGTPDTQAPQPRKRPLQTEDTVHVRIQETKEPDLKRMKRSGGVYRREDISGRWKLEDKAAPSKKRAFQYEDAVRIRMQADNEPDLKRIKKRNGTYMGNEKEEDTREQVREETREQSLGEEGLRLPSRRRTLIGIGEKWTQRRKERQGEMLEEQTIRPTDNSQLDGEEEEEL
jgi:hypothetical protein